jgi:hypothetical protein
LAGASNGGGAGHAGASGEHGGAESEVRQWMQTHGVEVVSQSESHTWAPSPPLPPHLGGGEGAVSVGSRGAMVGVGDGVTGRESGEGSRGGESRGNKILGLVGGRAGRIVERELRERRIEREREVQVSEMGGERLRGAESGGGFGSACTDAHHEVMRTPLAMREAWKQQVIAVRAHIHRELNEAS